MTMAYEDDDLEDEPQTLLDQAIAQTIHPCQAKEVDMERLQVVLAWYKGMVSTNAVSHVLKTSRQGVYTSMAAILRKAIRLGKVDVTLLSLEEDQD